mmetsp:Transcript_34056/g.70315  ORF Transcript_34056/g.70315 Transcript_34056/m.70315 type:complete len:100 (+) Transcript_34056:1118-1417(+)
MPMQSKPIVGGFREERGPATEGGATVQYPQEREGRRRWNTLVEGRAKAHNEEDEKPKTGWNSVRAVRRQTTCCDLSMNFSAQQQRIVAGRLPTQRRGRG